MRNLRRLLVLLCLLGAGSLVRAEIVVIVDARSGIERLTRSEAINIFLGRYRKLPDGRSAIPIEPATEALRADFYRRLVDKDLGEISAYWARLHFSGKTAPPLQAATPADVVTQVLARPGGIGYIERKDADTRVRIVLALEP